MKLIEIADGVFISPQKVCYVLNDNTQKGCHIGFGPGGVDSAGNGTVGAEISVDVPAKDAVESINRALWSGA